MGTLIDLMAVAAELEAAMEGMDVYVNTRTGEVTSFSAEWELDEGCDVPDFEAPEWACLERLESDEEWSIRQGFALSQSSPQIADDLRAALGHGRSFSNFRHCLDQHGLWDTWYAYRESAFVDHARTWLELHGHAYTEGSDPCATDPGQS